jgi:ubiquinone biosynthesis protein COQ4
MSIPIPSVPHRVRTVVKSLATLARDPGRLDQVLVLAQTVNIPAVARAMDRLEQNAEGHALLEEQPRIDRAHVDFDALRRLPDGTLGREYARFLDDNGITPDAFEALPDVGDARAAYVMLRMRQTHDLWHVLTGYTPDVRGEILLQAFTYSQTRAPSALIIAIFGTVRWAFAWPGQGAALREAFARGKRTGFLPTFRWEEHWATPVSELRELLHCPPAHGPPARDVVAPQRAA